jgi:hypothetical protein
VVDLRSRLPSPVRVKTSIAPAVNRIAFLISIALAAGCSDESGPQLVPVSGRVLLDGTPIGPGSLSLRPDPAAGSWDQPAGMIADDGSYRVFTNGHVGALAGDYAVVVFIHEQPTDSGSAHPGLPKSLIPTRYNDATTSGLSLTVSSDAPPDAYDLELSSHAD